VAKFKSLRMTLTNQNSLHKEVNSTLNKYRECLLIFGPESSIFLFTKQNIKFYLLFYMGVKLGLSHYSKNTD